MTECLRVHHLGEVDAATRLISEVSHLLRNGREHYVDGGGGDRWRGADGGRLLLGSGVGWRQGGVRAGCCLGVQLMTLTADVCRTQQ